MASINDKCDIPIAWLAAYDLDVVFNPKSLIALPPKTFALFSSDKLDIFLITSTVRGQVATASPWSKSLPMMML